MTELLAMHNHGHDLTLIREYLRDRTIGCPSCQYNLRGVESDKCPECGIHLQLSLDSQLRTLGPWLTSLFGVCLPLGFTSIMAAIACIGGLHALSLGSGQSPWFTPWNGNDTFTLITLLILSGCYFIVLRSRIRNRGSFLARPQKEQWIRAVVFTAVMFTILAGSLLVWAVVVNDV